MAKTERAQTRVRGFDGPEMDFQLLRQLGAGNYGGSTPGLSLHAAGQIPDGDAGAWVKVFAEQGAKLAEDAAVRRTKGFFVSARDQYMLAANALRAAEYYAWDGTEERTKLGLATREAFVSGLGLCAQHMTEVREVAWQGVRMPVYILLPANEPGPRPTLLVMSGFDGTCEEMYFCGGLAGVQRGFTVVLFAGPGQADARRWQDCAFVPEWEGPVGAVLDSLAGHPAVNPAKIGLLGVSLGGYFATRAAAFEPRIKALVANSPIVDLHAYMVGMVGYDPAVAPDEYDLRPGDELTDEDLAGDAETPRSASEVMRSVTGMCGRFGQPSFNAVFRRLKDFAVDAAALGRIKVPCLGMVGEGEGEEPLRQAEVWKQGVGGPVTLRSFTTAEGADSHCQVGNQVLAAAEMYDWLETVFR